MNKKIPTLPAANEPQGPDQALLQAIANLPAEAGPPAHLDAAILNAAQRAVRVRPLARIRPWLSVAAAVFVTFFAANLLQRESPDDSIDQIQQQPAPSAASKEMEASDDRMRQTNSQLSEEITAAGALDTASAESAAATVADTPAAAAQSAPMKARREAPAAPKPAALKSELTSPAPLDQGIGSRPDPFPAAVQARKNASEEAKTDQTGVRRDQLPESETVVNPRRMKPVARVPAPASAPAPAPPVAQPMRAPTPPPAPPKIAKEARRAVAGDAAVGRATTAPESSSAESAAGMMPSTLAPQRAKSTADQGPGRPQSDWIAQLRELLAAGDAERAKAVLAEFRKIYPQAELPRDLRSLETD